MKKIFLIILLLFALMTICACGSDSETEEMPVTQETLVGLTDDETIDEADEAVESEADSEPEEPSKVGEEISDDDFSVADLGDGTCEILTCYSDATVIEVPETLCGYTVIGVGQNAFSMTEASQIILPDTVEYIDDYAFSICENLKTVNFGEGLQQTGCMIFNECNALENITLPESMTTMASALLGVCENVKEVYIPASVVNIPEGIASIVLCPNIVIVTPTGSVAEAAAIEAGLPVRNS